MKCVLVGGVWGGGWGGFFFFFFQAEDGIRDHCVTGVQTCALPILYTDANGHIGCSVML